MRSKCSCGLVEVENFILSVLWLVGYNSGFPVSSLGSSVQIPFDDGQKGIFENASCKSGDCQLVQVQGKAGGRKKAKEAREKRRQGRMEETGDPPSFLFVSFHSIFMNYKHSNIHRNIYIHAIYNIHAYM